MKRSTRWALTGAAALTVVAAGGGVALAGGEDEAEGPDVAITGPALEKASKAALDHVDDTSAKVTDTEVGDEEGFYEVEVTLGNGDEVDVHLDEDFKVLSDEVDEVDAPGDDD